jgi:hypothetical protein
MMTSKGITFCLPSLCLVCNQAECRSGLGRRGKVILIAQRFVQKIAAGRPAVHPAVQEDSLTANDSLGGCSSSPLQFTDLAQMISPTKGSRETDGHGL